MRKEQIRSPQVAEAQARFLFLRENPKENTMSEVRAQRSEISKAGVRAQRSKITKRSMLLLFLVVAATFLFTGCANLAETNKSSVAGNTESAAGKIPITTSSEEARKEFLQGRDLNEK